MDSFLNVLKPPGMTSHDVVSAVRRIVNTRRVGHAGTLDPGAAGVLVVGVERATRLLDYVAAARKRYVAELRLGMATDTQDAEGTVVARGDASSIDVTRLLATCAELTGEIEQVPPMYSAVKVDGQRLYALARRGREVERPARRVTVHDIDVLEFAPGATAAARLRIECSSGLYVRTLCHDLGVRLGVPAHMGFLVRTRVGAFGVDTAQTLEEIAAEPSYVPPAEALQHIPGLAVDEAQQAHVVHGRRFPVDEDFVACGTVVRLLDASGRLLALARCEQAPEGTVCHPFVVLVTADSVAVSG